jgi:hypothetical protein
MKVVSATFQEYLKQINFKEHGDRFEQVYGDYLLGSFPNCERFWKVFVVPFTERINGYPDKIILSTNIRSSIEPEIEDIANMHYSMFLNLAFAHLHLETKIESSIEDIYVHMGSACDLAEAVIENWYILLSECQEKKVLLLQELIRDEFLDYAGKWFAEKYSTLYEYYKLKGKVPLIQIPAISGLLTEYFGKDSLARKNYLSFSQNIRSVRNVIVHNVRIARIVDQQNRILIPRSAVIDKYRSWRDVQAVITDEKVISRDFEEQYQQATNDLGNLERLINNLWDKLLIDFQEEFFAAERSKLRDRYDIEFVANGPIILGIETEQPSIIPRPSGTYSQPYYGGTIEIHLKSPNDTDS